jgi:hypothetical protein
MRVVRCLLLAALAAGAGVPGLRAAAARPVDGEVLHAAPFGPIVEAPDGRSEMELVRFDERMTAKLQTLAPEESLRVDDWPISPGQRAQVILRRFDVYAPDAKIVVIENGVEREAPRSTQVFYRGTVEDGPEAGGRFVSWVDPETGNLGGYAATSLGVVALESPERGRGEARLALAQAFDPEGAAPSWSCGVPDDEGHPFWQAVRENRARRPVPPIGSSGPLAVLGTLSRTAIIAFDTDAEYLNLRFSNDTAAATTYIGQIVAGMSVIYERDVASVMGNGVKLLQGYTILRVGEASDPYSDTIGSADSTKLNEFGAYWDAQYPTTVVRRALAALLSGKQGSSGSASGIAWVGSLCAASAHGYSIDQLFTGAAGLTADLAIIAHEVGHNFGAFHTHNCYYGNPPIDTCVAPEGGCTTATGCPGSQVFNGVTTNGTLMSYCHVASCSPRNLVFHTRSVADNPADPFGIDSILTEVANASCMNILSGGVVPATPTITNVGPATGVLAGGTVLTITGTNFVNGATVAFVELPSNNVFGTPSSKVAASVTFNSSTQLTATTPSASSAGAVDVVVMNPDFQTATRASGFTYTTAPPAPTVTAVSPNTGSTGGGTSVTITGANFVGTPSVVIGGANATSEVFVNSTTLTATTPAHAAGIVNVVVTNPDAQSGTLTNGYAYLPPPSASRYWALTPCRLFDTRNTTGPDAASPILAANSTRTFDVSGRCGVPEAAISLTVNVTVTGSGATGELRLFPGNGISPNPPASSIFYAAGKTRANNGIVRLSTDGTATIKVQNVSAAAVHFILDVSGSYLVP